MKRSGGILLGLLLAGVLVAAVWWFFLRASAPPVPGQPATEPAVSEADDEDVSADVPDEEFPVPDVVTDHGPSELDGEEPGQSRVTDPEPLPEPPPTLDGSDGFMQSLLERIFSPDVLENWLKDERVVERLVVTINSMDGPAISLRFWPVQHIEGLPDIEHNGDTLRWSKANTERYRPLIEILQAAEPKEVARVYFHSYPLFQQAYGSLGLEDAHFNDRLVEIVDHLLGAPEVEPGFEVKQPKVLYEFSDPELEAESWGRKLLMRMGPDNAAAVKNWLRALRKELVSGKVSAEEASDAE